MYIVRGKITLSALLNEFAEYCRNCQGGSLHEQRGTCWKIRTILTALISRTNRMCRTTWLWCSLSFQLLTRVWWASLTPKTFQTSILCQKIGISHDGFYSSMQESQVWCFGFWVPRLARLWPHYWRSAAGAIFHTLAEQLFFIALVSWLSHWCRPWPYGSALYWHGLQCEYQLDCVRSASRQPP